MLRLWRLSIMLEFFNSFYVLLVFVNSRRVNCDSLMELDQSSTSASYSRFPEACLKRRNSCTLKYFGVLHLVLSRRKLSCEQFSSPFSFTTFTTHSSSVETGIQLWLRLCLPIQYLAFCSGRQWIWLFTFLDFFVSVITSASLASLSR